MKNINPVYSSFYKKKIKKMQMYHVDRNFYKEKMLILEILYII